MSNQRPSYKELQKRLAQAEIALQSSKAYLQAVLNSVKDAVFVHDANTGQIIDLHRQLDEMHSPSGEKGLHTPTGDLNYGQPPYSPAQAVEWSRQAQEGGPQDL